MRSSERQRGRKWATTPTGKPEKGRKPSVPSAKEGTKVVEKHKVAGPPALDAIADAIGKAVGTAFAHYLRLTQADEKRPPNPAIGPAGESAAAPRHEARPSDIQSLDPSIQALIDQVVREIPVVEHHPIGEVLGFTPSMADRIRRIAREKGFKQIDLARRIGVTPAVISRIFKNPDRSQVDTLAKLAGAMGVDLEAFFISTPAPAKARAGR